jgi:hypothetical protein
LAFGLFGWRYVLPIFCPADTFLSGLLGLGILEMIGSPMIGVPGLLLLVGLMVHLPKRPRPADILQTRRGRIAGIAGTCLLVIGIVMALDALSSSYCAGPQGIFIPAKPFGERRIYAWSDIRKITTHCGRTTHTFDAEMNDGQTIELGEYLYQFIPNYRAVSDALRDVPFVYDNLAMSDRNCRSSLRDLFATRPGAHVNEPR